MSRITGTTPTVTNRYQTSAPVGVLVPASGTSSTDGSGPWFIETQSLGGVFKRVPHYGLSAMSWNLNNPLFMIKVAGTVLQTFVNATYSIKKSYDWYDTSAYTQLQQFEWFGASADSYGNSYGDASSIGASALGPDGWFITNKPFQLRRLWTSADDVSGEVNHHAAGSTHAFIAYTTQYTPTMRYTDGMVYWGDFKHTKNAQHEGSPLAAGVPAMWNKGYSGREYQLPGAYSTSQESPILIANWIDELGFTVRVQKLYRPSWDSADEIPMDVGIVHYKPQRHYWT